MLEKLSQIVNDCSHLKKSTKTSLATLGLAVLPTGYLPTVSEAQELSSVTSVVTPVNSISNLANYKYDQYHRIIEIKFPTGLVVSDIVYQGESNIIGELKITKDSKTTKYLRNTPYSRMWRTETSTRKSTYDGNFYVSKQGELAVLKGLYSGALWEIYKPDGIKTLGRPRWDGSTSYYDRHNGAERITEVSRANGSNLKYHYDGANLVGVTHTDIKGDQLSWKYNFDTKLWESSSAAIQDSKEAPVKKRSALVYKLKDETLVLIATCGSETRSYKDGHHTNIDPKGRIYKVGASGISSRTFEYNNQGDVIAYKDHLGAQTQTKILDKVNDISYHVEHSGAITAYLTSEQNPNDSVVSEYCIAAPQLNSQYRFSTRIPKTPEHIHPFKTTCKDTVCPNGTEWKYTALSDTSVQPLGHQRYQAIEVSTWTSLDEIAKKRGGLLKPLVKALRVWASTTTDKDIERVNSAEFLQELKGKDDQPWINSELLRYSNTEYMLWLRDCINNNRLPCDIDIVTLTPWNGSSQEGYGGVTNTKVNGIDHKLDIKVQLQLANFSTYKLGKDLTMMEQYGGVGLYYRPQATLVALFHELQHVWAYSNGYDYIHTEPPAYLAAVQCLLTIDQEKAKLYKSILN